MTTAIKLEKHKDYVFCDAFNQIHTGSLVGLKRQATFEIAPRKHIKGVGFKHIANLGEKPRLHPNPLPVPREEEVKETKVEDKKHDEIMQKKHEQELAPIIDEVKKDEKVLVEVVPPSPIDAKTVKIFEPERVERIQPKAPSHKMPLRKKVKMRAILGNMKIRNKGKFKARK